MNKNYSQKKFEQKRRNALESKDIMLWCMKHEGTFIYLSFERAFGSSTKFEIVNGKRFLIFLVCVVCEAKVKIRKNVLG